MPRLIVTLSPNSLQKPIANTLINLELLMANIFLILVVVIELFSNFRSNLERCLFKALSHRKVHLTRLVGRNNLEAYSI